MSTTDHGTHSIESLDCLFKREPPNIGGSLDHSRRDINRKWRVVRFKNGKRHVQIVGVAVVEGEGRKARTCATVNPICHTIHVNDFDSPALQSRQHSVEKFWSHFQCPVGCECVMTRSGTHAMQHEDDPKSGRLRRHQMVNAGKIKCVQPDTYDAVVNLTHTHVSL